MITNRLPVRSAFVKKQVTPTSFKIERFCVVDDSVVSALAKLGVSSYVGANFYLVYGNDTDYVIFTSLSSAQDFINYNLL